ncbi:MAG TPA: copper transporter [Firmicutes bacterium]|nr:copper transporter [Bacillota bacterium]
MIIDMRYHIASLVAVFLALGLGILIGSAMGGNDALIEQQKRLIDRLEMDFAQIKQDREKLQVKLNLVERELASSVEFEKTAFPVLVAGKLQSKNVAIIRTGDSVSRRSEEAIVRALKDAGANITSVTTVLRPFELTSGDARARDELFKCLGLDAIQTEPQPKDIPVRLATALAREIASGTGLTLVPALEELGFVQVSGRYQGYVDAVVILGGSSEESRMAAKSVDLPLIDAFSAFGVRVVGVEAAGASKSYMKLYKEKGIPTVDNADMVLGQLSLVFALAGENGHYGIKETARQPFPDFLGGLTGKGNYSGGSR